MNPESFIGKKLIYFFSILLFLLGIRFVLFITYIPVLKDGQKVSFTTTMLEEPRVRGHTTQFSVFYGNIFAQQKLSISTNATTDLSYGDVVRISGTVTKKLLSKNRIAISLYSPRIEADPQEKSQFLAIINSIRQKVKTQYFFTLSSTYANLLFGIVFGIKGEFPKTFLQEMQSAGVLHVIAASGMNITLLAGVIFSLTSNFFRRQISIVVTILAMVLYTALAGFQSSILRAAVMALFAFTGQLFGRQYSGLYGLFLAATFLLLWNPALLFDVGFELSVFATLGILVVKPLFPKISLLEDVSTTIAAQLVTLPILLINFSSYGLLSILVNALVLWTIPPLMILGGIGAILCFLYVPAAQFFIWICTPLLWFFAAVVRVLGGVGWNLSVGEIPEVVAIGYYLLLSAVVLCIKNRLFVGQRIEKS